MTLRHYLWTLLLCNVLICSMCGVQKVSSYKAAQYQSAVRRLQTPSGPHPRSHTRTVAFRPRSSIKGGGAPYSPLIPESQASNAMFQERGDLQHHITSGEPPVPKEQVKMIPEFHMRPELIAAAQSEVIQFGSAQTESASRQVNELLSGHGPASVTLGGAVNPEPARTRPATHFFGSGQSTGTSSSSRSNTASSGPSYIPSGSSGRRGNILLVRYSSRRNLVTERFITGSTTLPKPSSTPYGNVGVTLGSSFTTRKIHHNTERSNVANLATRFSSTRRNTLSSHITSGAVLSVPGGHEGDPNTDSSENVQPTLTGERNVHSVVSYREVRPPTSTVEGGASLSPSRSSSPGTDTNVESSAESVKSGRGSTGNSHESSLYSSGRPAGSGPDPGFTRGAGSGPVFIWSVTSGGARRSYRCVGKGCNPTGYKKVLSLLKKS